MAFWVNRKKRLCFKVNPFHCANRLNREIEYIYEGELISQAVPVSELSWFPPKDVITYNPDYFDSLFNGSVTFSREFPNGFGGGNPTHNLWPNSETKRADDIVLLIRRFAHKGRTELIFEYPELLKDQIFKGDVEPFVQTINFNGEVKQYGIGEDQVFEEEDEYSRFYVTVWEIKKMEIWLQDAKSCFISHEDCFQFLKDNAGSLEGINMREISGFLNPIYSRIQFNIDAQAY